MYPPTEVYSKIGSTTLPRLVIPRGPYTGVIKELREILGTTSAKVEVQKYEQSPSLDRLVKWYFRLILPRITLPSGYECVLVPRNQKTGEAVVLRSRDHSTTNVGFYKHHLGREYLNRKEALATVRSAFPARNLVVDELRLEKQVNITKRTAHELFPEMVDVFHTNGYHASREGIRDYNDCRLTAVDLMKARDGEHFLKDGKMLVVYLMDPTYKLEGVLENQLDEECILYTTASIWLQLHRTDIKPEVSDFLVIDKLSEMLK